MQGDSSALAGRGCGPGMALLQTQPWRCAPCKARFPLSGKELAGSQVPVATAERSSELAGGRRAQPGQNLEGRS